MVIDQMRTERGARRVSYEGLPRERSPSATVRGGDYSMPDWRVGYLQSDGRTGATRACDSAAWT